ncbi:MAG: ThiF family adenylyltransferase [Planctomycetaceae bacterium]|nr:ThiF family adenylyltransferase [Planctomycetaceae bacterium]
MLETLGTVGALPPESGAKGFGPMDRLGFDRIEFDVRGSADGGVGVYRPNVDWGNERCRYHLSVPKAVKRVWTGDIHSHPGSEGVPSGGVGPAMGDLAYVEEVFAMNEAMLYFLIPILTATGTDEVVIHPWVCHRESGLMIATVRVVEREQFPVREFNPVWLASQRKTVIALGDVVENGSQREEAAASHDWEHKGVRAGLETREMEDETVDQMHRRRYRLRLDGIVSPEFSGKSASVVGVGAGSCAVEKLARFSLRQIRLCDFDRVEIENLSRTCFTYPDACARRLKVDAMRDRLSWVNPFVDVVTYPTNITSLSDDAVASMFEGVDLVVAGTDSFAAQALINKLTYDLSIPTVFVGIHADAAGGRIVWTVPGMTPCYRCVAHDRFEAAKRLGKKALDLPAARGSLVDCQFVDLVALKVCLAILERGRDSIMGRFFDHMGLRNEIVVRCDPTYEWGNRLWDAILGDLPTTPKDFAREIRDAGLFAMDTLWMRGTRFPDCPVCGRRKTGQVGSEGKGQVDRRGH